VILSGFLFSFRLSFEVYYYLAYLDWLSLVSLAFAELLDNSLDEVCVASHPFNKAPLVIITLPYLNFTSGL